MTKHLIDAITMKVPQSEPLDGQIANSAGGFSWQVDEWTHLRRFLILGSESGTYYISEKDLTKSGLKTIEKCLVEDASRLVLEIVDISESGRAPKNDYALFALATVVAKGNDEAKSLALSALPRVARIGTHLFQFVSYLDAFGNLTGRAKRRALAKWYTEKDPDKLAYQLIKYRNREGWTHRDILRIAHPGSISEVSDEHKNIFDWVTGGVSQPIPELITGFNTIQTVSTVGQAIGAIKAWNLPREAVPTEFLTDSDVWQALLETDMPMTALVRNLGNMSRNGLLTGTSDATQIVVNKLQNEDAIRNSRIHPLNILFALKTYESGGGWRSSNTWTPVSQIVDALNDAFYLAFGNVESSGKRILLALDVSGSMSSRISGTNLSAREAASAMALVTANVEDRYDTIAFSWNGLNPRGYGYTNRSVIPFPISPRERLDDLVRKTSYLPFSGTDCALPMIYAMENGKTYDAFIIYTDSETWAGNVHPSEALKDYRRTFVPDARLVVVGMTSNGFSIADPNDAGMLDVVGFDTNTPNIISEFIAGRI